MLRHPLSLIYPRYVLVRDVKLLHEEEGSNKRVMRLLIDRFENFYIHFIHTIYSSLNIDERTREDINLWETKEVGDLFYGLERRWDVWRGRAKILKPLLPSGEEPGAALKAEGLPDVYNLKAILSLRTLIRRSRSG
jgi:hypothetical protein